MGERHLGHRDTPKLLDEWSRAEGRRRDRAEVVEQLKVLNVESESKFIAVLHSLTGGKRLSQNNLSCVL